MTMKEWKALHSALDTPGSDHPPTGEIVYTFDPVGSPLAFAQFFVLDDYEVKCTKQHPHYAGMLIATAVPKGKPT